MCVWGGRVKRVTMKGRIRRRMKERKLRKGRMSKGKAEREREDAEPIR